LETATVVRRLLAADSFATIAVAQVDAGPAADALARTVRPLLAEYCTTCHSTERHKGDWA
jgi:hypothetical protein